MKDEDSSSSVVRPPSSVILHSSSFHQVAPLQVRPIIPLTSFEERKPMIELDIPGRGIFRIEHLVLDVNGTIAKDGRLLDKVAKPLAALKDRVTIHLLTADTYGK